MTLQVNYIVTTILHDKEVLQKSVTTIGALLFPWNQTVASHRLWENITFMAVQVGGQPRTHLREKAYTCFFSKISNSEFSNWAGQLPPVMAKGSAGQAQGTPRWSGLLVPPSQISWPDGLRVTGRISANPPNLPSRVFRGEAQRAHKRGSLDVGDTGTAGASGWVAPGLGKQVKFSTVGGEVPRDPSGQKWVWRVK